jgi:outer membrane protein OmpA-like peptidoglycan-associated protein
MACLAAVLWSAGAAAGPPKIQLFEEVEKGFEIGGHLGLCYDFVSPVENLNPGLLVGIEVGYDLTWIFRIKLGFDDHIYSGRSPNRRGTYIDLDFEERLVWGGASLALLATDRFYVYVQAGIGYLFTTPKQVDGIDAAGPDDLAILAGGGLEYYTTLRHFSFGVEANAMVMPIRGDVAISVYPVIRYTFGVSAVQVIKPPKDRDNDGVPDEKDKCPDTWGVESEQGCPEPDTDQDGVIDREDHCPQEPGPASNNGCPEQRDQDKDGLPDKIDRCPTEPGPPENEGCPEEDSDEDGIPDRIDLCPTKRGLKKYDGCPSKSDIKIKVKKKAIELREKIHFETNKAKIKQESHNILDQVAATLKQFPEIKKMEIQGHTDSRGSNAYNLDLSQRRSQAVVDYLVGKGIDPDRLLARGYGEEQPIAPNNTSDGRAMNRRVEMIILERD